MQSGTKKWLLFLSIAIAIETAIGNGGVSLTNVFPKEWTPYIVGWCGFLAFIGSTIMAAITGGSLYSSPAITDAAKKAVPLILAGIFLLAFAFPANAQPKQLQQLQIFGKTLPPSGAPQSPSALMDKISAVSKDILDGVIADINAANADASAIDPDTNKPRDAIAAACYPEQVKFLSTLPIAGPLEGKFIVVQLFQRKRDFVISLQKGLPVSLKIGCGALLGDEVNIAVKTLAMVGVAVSVPALAPMLPAVTALPILPAL